MRKDWKQEVYKTNLEVLSDYTKFSTTWRNNALRMEDSRYGKQFSQREEEVLLQLGQAALPISVSSAIADAADALMVSSKPIPYVAPIPFPFDSQRFDLSRKVATLYTSLIQNDWQNCHGSLQYKRIIRDSGNVGHGLAYIVPKSSNGEFSVDVRHISWRYFLPDPSSTDPLYSDMDNMIYFVPLSEVSAFKYAKNFEPELTIQDFKNDFVKGHESFNGGLLKEDSTYAAPARVNRGESKTVPVIHRFTLEDTVNYLIVPMSDELNRDSSRVGYRYFDTISDDLIALERAGKIKIVEKYKFNLCEYISIGGLGFKKSYPISRYNIVPLVFDHRDTPYPYGLQWKLYPLQRALNKFIMSALLNASILNSTKVLAEEGSIANLDEWMRFGATPNAILQYRMAVPGYSEAPKIINATPMSEAWLIFPKYLTQMMEYISGIYSTMQGDPSNSPETFSTVASLNSAGSLKIKSRLADVDVFLSTIGEVVGELYKNYAPPNGFSVSLNKDSANFDTIQYNKVMTENDPVTGEVKAFIDPETDLSIGFHNVRFTSQGSSGHEAGTQALALTTLATQLGIPDLAPLIVKLLNIPGTEDIPQKLDRVSQLTSQNREMENAIKELEKRTMQYQKQIESLMMQVKVEQYETKLQKEYQNIKADPTGYAQKSAAGQAQMAQQQEQPQEQAQGQGQGQISPEQLQQLQMMQQQQQGQMMP